MNCSTDGNVEQVGEKVDCPVLYLLVKDLF